MNRILVHSFGLVHHLYASYVSLELSTHKYEDPTVRVSMDYGTLYLTYWNLIFQTVFLAMSLTCDLVERKGLKPNASLVRLKEIVFHGLVFPFTVYVFVTFWTLFALNREYVYPVVLDEVMPWWLNHSVHTVILVVLGLELAVQPRPHPEEGPHYLLALVTMHVYSVVYHAAYFLHGIWMYPFYYLMSWPFIILWQFKFTATMHLFYFLQWPLLKYLYKSPTHSKVE